MFPQIVYAQYGNHRSFYGNIQLGAAPKIIQSYGAWPEEQPVQKGMLVGDWQEEPETIESPKSQNLYAQEIASRIAIIRRIKYEIDAENDLRRKNLLREHMRIERMAKERAFKLKAMIDEEETLFILLQ